MTVSYKLPRSIRRTSGTGLGWGGRADHVTCRTRRRRQTSPSPMRTAVEAWVSAQGSGIVIEPLVIPKGIGVPSTIVSKLSGDGSIVIVSVPLGVVELTAKET